MDLRIMGLIQKTSRVERRSLIESIKGGAPVREPISHTHIELTGSLKLYLSPMN